MAEEEEARCQAEDKHEKEEERKEQEKKQPKINDFNKNKIVAYGLTKVNDLVALKPVASIKVSHNVIQDADLTWRQMNVGKNTMLCFMDLCNWPQKHIQSLAHFYFNIELEPMWSCPNGEKILIAYQARVQ